MHSAQSSGLTVFLPHIGHVAPLLKTKVFMQSLHMFVPKVSRPHKSQVKSFGNSTSLTVFKNFFIIILTLNGENSNPHPPTDTPLHIWIRLQNTFYCRKFGAVRVFSVKKTAFFTNIVSKKRRPTIDIAYKS